MRKIILQLIGLSLLAACSNLEDAELSDRKTFFKDFSAPHNFSASALEIIPDGYAILGSMDVNDTLVISALIETDHNGNQIGDIHYFRQASDGFNDDGFNAKSFKPIISNGILTGYVIVGDSTRINPGEDQAANIVIASLKLLQVNSTDFSINKRYIRTDKRAVSPQHPVKVDYYGRSLTLTDDGRVYVIGGVKEGVTGQQASPELTQLIEFNNALDSVWAIEYDINDRTFQNSKTLIHQNGKIIWASGLAIEQAGFNTSYVAIPVAQEKSTFINFSQIGQTSDQLFVPGDISTTHNPAFGFGVTGTYSIETNGTKGNVFFLRVNQNGDIIPGSDRYFDGATGTENQADPTQSNVIDQGEAISSTSDGGFVIAGTTSLVSGKGKDLWLIKINSLGDAVWSKTFGGSGDEVPTSIRQLSTGEILICGTKTIGGFSSIFLLKTDKNGDLNE